MRSVVCLSMFLTLLPVAAQDSGSTDLLRQVDVDGEAVVGTWRKLENEVRISQDSKRGLLPIPAKLDDRYELQFEFTRQSGDDLVGLILPLGSTHVSLELSAWNGTAHGLSRINQSSVKDDRNPTSIRPGTLENGRRHRVSVFVSYDERRASIRTELDDRPLVAWTGSLERVEPNLVYRLDNDRQPALIASNSDVVFHRVTLNRSPKSDSKGAMKKTGDGRTEIDLTRIDWKETQGEVGVVDFQAEAVARTKGRDDTVAFLPGIVLSDGVIEVEIASDIFSGIAVRGQDTANYDLIYFRPQNSGTKKHENSVQYVCKGKDGADWRSLRDNFPGKYEAGADMEMDQWFRVRIELKGSTLTAYVNDFKKPVLVVEKMLGEQASGKIGLWGWDSHFRNFSFRED